MMSEKYRRYASLVVTLLFVVTAFASMSGFVSGTSNSAENTVTQSFTMNLSSVKYVHGPDGSYLIVDGLRMMNVPGKPVIPFKTFEFNLPHNANVLSVELQNKYYVDYPTKIKISPGKLPALKDGRKLPNTIPLHKITQETYQKNAYYPDKEITYKVDRTNNNEVVRVYLYPVRYNPVTMDAKILTNGKIVVHYTLSKSSTDVKAPPINVPNIIITSPELKDQAQRLADFHNSTGVTSWVVTTDWIASHYSEAGKPPFKGYGDTQTDSYNNPYAHGPLPLKHDGIVGYNFSLAQKIVSFLRAEEGGNVKYITIFGNARMVPPSYYWVDQYMYLVAYIYENLYQVPGDYYDAWIPTDAFYESPDYTSTSFDFTPNFELGRIPVNPLTAKVVVDKIIYYEQHKTLGIRNITLSGGQVFETPYFLGETADLEPLNNGWFNGLNVTEYFHTLRNYTFDNFLNMMHNSDMIIEVTHGSGFSFWHHNDEVSAWDFPMNGSYGSLPIYVSGSCLNGAWDEEVYPAYEMSYGINGGTSIAEKMIYSPVGSIAYFGGDREAYGSTYAYYINGTLVAPNDFGDLITEDGTSYGYYKAMNDSGVVYLGDLGYWAHYMYQSWVAQLDNVSLSAVDPFNSGWNDNPWARSYFEYSALGDPALKIADRSSTPTNYYNLPDVEVANPDHYNAANLPVVKRGSNVIVNITTNSTNVRVELLYLEHDVGYSPYMEDNEETYYDFVLDNVVLPTISGKTFYAFTPEREGIYIVSVYTMDGKNTRLYISVEMPTAPPLKVMSSYNSFNINGFDAKQITMNAPSVKATSGVSVVTILDYETVIIGKDTNATAVLYNNGDTPVTGVTVQFYLENYTLVFKDKNLNKPLVNLGEVTVSSIPAHGYAYATIQWTAHDLHAEHPSWDPHYSSARWQYFVAKADSSENWALFRVHDNVDVWSQKVFIEKEPAYGVPNNVTVEITNVGLETSGQTTIILQDKFGVINTTTVSNIGPYQTVFLKIPWTPQGYGNDNLSVNTTTVGDINKMNDNSSYYPNGYYGVSQFKVLNFDLTPVNITQKDMNLTVQVYNYGPNKADTSTLQIYEIPGAKAIDVESPHPYPNNYNHTWEINVPGASQIALHFKYLDVEKGYDYVNISDQNHKLVASYTGYYKDLWTPVVSGSTVYVTLRSDVAVNYTGFYIDLYTTKKPSTIHVGDVQFSTVNSGEYANQSIPINLTNHVVYGECAFKLVVKAKGDVATLTTGGSDNNIATIPGKIVETNNKSSIPQISLLAPADGSIVGGSVNLYLNLKDSIAASIYNATVKIDGSTSHQQFSLQSNWTLKGQLTFSSDGTHTISINVTDAVNHNSNILTFHLTSDTTPPKVTITSPSNGAILNSKKVTISWNIVEAHLDHINIPNYATDLPPSTTSYTINVSGDGEYNITVSAVDKVGNTGSAWVDFTVDTTPPMISFTAPKNNSIVSTTSVSVEWSVTDKNLKSVEIWFDNTAPQDVTGKTSTTLSLSSGTHKIYLKATDAAGNTKVAWITVTVEATPFTVKNANPSSGTTTSSTNITITITFSHQADPSTLKWNVTGGEYNKPTFHWENNNTVLVVTITGLEKGKSYKFIIESLKDTGGSELQNVPYTYEFSVKGKSSGGEGGIPSSTLLWVTLAIVIIAIIAGIAVWYAKKGKMPTSEEPMQEEAERSEDFEEEE